MSCPGNACPQFIGQGCRCIELWAAASAAQVHTPDVIDMRDPDRHWHPDTYVEPVPTS